MCSDLVKGILVTFQAIYFFQISLILWKKSQGPKLITKNTKWPKDFSQFCSSVISQTGLCSALTVFKHLFLKPPQSTLVFLDSFEGNNQKESLKECNLILMVQSGVESLGLFFCDWGKFSNSYTYGCGNECD